MKPLLLLLIPGLLSLQIRAQIDLSIFDGTGVEAPEEERPDAEDAGDPDAEGGDAASEAGADSSAPEGMTGEGEAPPGEEAPEIPNGDGEEEETLLPGGPLVPEGEDPLPGEEDEDSPPQNGESASEEQAGEEEAEPGIPGQAEEEIAMPDPDPEPETEEAGVPARGGRATEVFQPAERIPADQSVDFPWDI